MLVYKKCMGCGCGYGHSDMNMSTRTWTQADWKCEHKIKVKKVKTTHQTYCKGRQGQPQQV